MIRRLIEKLFGLEPESCMNCETLRSLLEAERNERTRLTQALIEVTNPSKPVVISEPQSDLKPIANHTPWRVRRQSLEQEDRQRARILKQYSTESLEKAVGLVPEFKPEKEYILEKHSSDATGTKENSL